MGIGGTLLFFGIPGALMVLGVRVGVPAAESWGWPRIVSYPVFLWLPVLLLVSAVLTRFLRADGSGAGFRKRFRFGSMSRRDWLFTALGFLVVQALELGLAPTRRWLSRIEVFAPPESTPELFDPFLEIETGLETLFGVPLEGNWWLVAFWLGWLVVNIGAEEILWRGYALPLQEKVFGGYAWLVNGLAWNLLVHAFMPWGYITLLPISLVVPYLAQKRGNSWVGVIIHGLGNLLLLAVLIPAIVG